MNTFSKDKGILFNKLIHKNAKISFAGSLFKEPKTYTFAVTTTLTK